MSQDIEISPELENLINYIGEQKYPNGTRRVPKEKAKILMNRIRELVKTCPNFQNYFENVARQNAEKYPNGI